MTTGAFATLLHDASLVLLGAGASYFLPDTWTPLFALKNSRFILIDPCGQNLTYAQGHPAEKVLTIPLALASYNGVSEFFEAHIDSGSSLYPPAVYKNRPELNKDYFFPLKIKDIEVSSLEQCLNQHAVEYIHAIKLDTQGSELDIVKGLDAQRLSRLLLVEMEVSLDSTPSYLGSARLSDVINYFEAEGFRYTNTRIARKSLQGSGLDLPMYSGVLAAQHEADVLFVRDLFSIEYTSVEDFLCTARQLMALYCAYYLHGQALEVLDMALEAMPSAKMILQPLRDVILQLAQSQTQFINSGALSLWHRDK